MKSAMMRNPPACLLYTTSQFRPTFRLVECGFKRKVRLVTDGGLGDIPENSTLGHESSYVAHGLLSHCRDKIKQLRS